jgi:hypothetical protein
VFISKRLICTLAVVLSVSGLTGQTRGPGFVAGASLGRPSRTARVTAPLLGYFFDREHGQLQSIVGLPGTGLLGAPISTQGAVATEIAPSQDFALMVQAESGRLARIFLEDDVPAPVPVEGSIDGVTMISISPTGASALVYAEATRRAQIFRGFPDRPALAHEFDWTALPGKLTAMAVNDAGDFALVAASTALYAVSEGSGASVIYTAQLIPSVSFLRNSREALAVATAEKQVIWIRDNSGVAAPAILADERAGIVAPQLIAPSEDGSRAFVLDGTAGVFTISMAGGQVMRASCDCRPSQLQRLRGRDVFLLTPSVGAALGLVDGSESLRVVSMPARQLPAVEEKKR